MRFCPLCMKPSALDHCCTIGKIPPADWTLEHLIQFLDVLKEDGNKWNRFGSLGDQVDYPLENGGYKEMFKKERLTGKLLFGKQRKTLSDLMKRIGVKNVKHRDLLVEAIYDLSKPLAPLTEQQMMEERIILVQNSWTQERRPDIQLHALADIMRASADSSRHQLLADLEVPSLLMTILNGRMMDPMLEEDLKERQSEIDELWEKRKARMLDYLQKKELDRKSHLQARDWVQWKADFGSLAVVAFGTLQNMSAGPVFKRLLVEQGFGRILADQLARFREAEKHLTLLRTTSRGQYMSLVASELQEQQLVVLSTVYNLSTLEANRQPLVEQGLARAAVHVAHVAGTKDGQRQLQCMKILCLLSLSGGKTEEQIVADGALAPVVKNLRESFGDTLLFAVTTLCNLAFLPDNRQAIVDAEAVPPLNQVLKRGDPDQQLKAIDAIRNIAAAGADLKLARIVVGELAHIVAEGAGEHRLRALIALRSISRFEETMSELVDRGVLQLVIDIAQEREDQRLCTQALGLLFNVVGFTAQPPLDFDDSDDDFTDEDEEEDEDEEHGDPRDPKDKAAEVAASKVEEPTSAPKLEEKSYAPSSQQSISPDSTPLSSPLTAQSSPIAGQASTQQTVSPEIVKLANRLLHKRISPFFKMLEARELDQLSTQCTYVSIAKNDVIAAQGEPSNTLFVLIQGRIRVLVSVGKAAKKLPVAPEGLAPARFLGDSESPGSSPLMPMTPMTSGSQSPVREGWTPLGVMHRPSTRKLIYSPMRQGKEMKEVARLKPGDTACELGLLEGKFNIATLVAMENSLLMEVKAEDLVPILLRRPELATVLKPAERISLTPEEQLHRLWTDPSMSDEAAERQAFFRIERSERRMKTQGKLLQLGALQVLESFVGEDRGPVNKFLAKSGLALLIGGIDQKENPLLEVDEDIIRKLQDCIDAASYDEEWHGHRYNLEVMLIGTRLLAGNDKNKRRFVQNFMIPFMLSLLKIPDQGVMQLSTAVLLDLSYGMRVRWLIRPVLTVWYKYVKQEMKLKERFSRPLPSQDTVDFAAPTHIVNVKAMDYDVAFTFELHEAASEGGLRWMQRLIEEEDVDPHTADDGGATAMHYAAMNGHIEAMDYLLDHGVDINIQDKSGCTPKAWLLMARFVEYGTDTEQWPEAWQRVVEWVDSKGAIAKFLPMFPFSV